MLGVGAYYDDRAGIVRAQVLLIGFSGALFLWFIGSLRAHLRRSEGDAGRLSAVAFGSGLAFVAVVGTGVIATSVLALSIDPGGSRYLAAFADLGEDAQAAAGGALVILHYVRLVALSLAGFAAAPMLAATALVSRRHGAFPGWLAWGSWALAALELVSAFGVLVYEGPLTPGSGFQNGVSLLFVVWLAVTSALLVRRATGPASAAAE